MSSLSYSQLESRRPAIPLNNLFLECPTSRSEKNTVISAALMDVIDVNLRPIELSLKLSQG